jgi:hypothetical protein
MYSEEWTQKGMSEMPVSTRLWSTGSTPDEPLAAETEWALVDGNGNVVVLIESD